MEDKNFKEKYEKKLNKRNIKLKILGFFMLIVGIILIILGVSIFREPFGFSGNMTTPNTALLIIGVFLAFFSSIPLFIGFEDKMDKAALDKAKYIKLKQNELKQDPIYKEILEEQEKNYNYDEEIIEQTITKKRTKTRYCDYCGSKLTSNAKFCSSCGNAITKDDK